MVFIIFRPALAQRVETCCMIYCFCQGIRFGNARANVVDLPARAARQIISDSSNRKIRAKLSHDLVCNSGNDCLLAGEQIPYRLLKRYKS
jgi:hypothetical protein